MGKKPEVFSPPTTSDLTIPMQYYHLLSLLCLGSEAAKSVTKTYLIGTNDGALVDPDPNFEPEPAAEEFGDNYGDHWTPRTYGQTQAPETAAPVTCTWDNWGGWSGTSATCGSGTKTRSRRCSCSDGTTGASGSCGGGSSTESTQVNNGPCYTCSMGPWSMWSGASASCGTSTSNRSRSCVCTDGVSRPSECGSGSTTDSRTNNHGPCTTKAPVWTPKPYRRRRN